ncbi:hypothetical protein EUA93_18845 [Nocardioides oleivorans]|uniref:Uncharacterized protein n=1 Tax=Nocardioides oleivorans TaxID=273676 RepID=A0A4Q2RSU1_9ACTN|nr:hypothetical protein [Nocardioides oleivorans]RYB90994.1 hypothetical protein EUA93_18845 [Nocardioides oleivorans]
MTGKLAALVLAVTMLTAAPAAAGDPWPDGLPWSTSHMGSGAKCASGWEQRQLEVDLSRADVEELLDGPGRAFPGKPNERYYRPCNRSWHKGQVVIIYKRDRLWNSFKVVTPSSINEVPYA